MANTQESSFEARCGVFIAIFAAIMAVNDLVAGKFGDDEIIGTNEKAAAYMWYQAKGIKENLVDGERSLLESLYKVGAIKPGAEQAIQEHIASLRAKTQRYKKEKDEILKGSQSVGKENWIQELNGQLGKIIGAQEIELHLATLAKAGDRFDLSSLFFQLCLVLGALSLILKKQQMQRYFFIGMCGLGTLGFAVSIWTMISLGVF